MHQIERAESWLEEQEERQKRREEAAKQRCEQLLDENRALSDEVKSLRDSTAGSPDLNTSEPPFGLPSGILPGGAGDFLAVKAKQAALNRKLTTAFGKEKAQMLRARSEAVAELYFGDV
jgi:cell division protein FtsB